MGFKSGICRKYIALYIEIGLQSFVIQCIFFFQGEELHYSLEEGVIITNQSLVLQKVSRTESGLYQCHAINQEGQGSSNTVNLPIKCKYCIVYSIDFLSDRNL